jgi:hydrogenase/urease accessory protein HupE
MKVMERSIHLRWLRQLGLCLALWGTCVLSHAHLISAGHASITLSPERSVMLVGVPVTFFRGVDQNQDGLLQPEEIKANRLQMIEQLTQAFKLRVGNTLVEAADDQLITSIKADNQGGAPQIEWLRQLKLQPSELNLVIEVQVEKALMSSEYVFQVKRMEDLEVAVLNNDNPKHQFFKNSWATLQVYFVEGWLHIILGYDHIIFILSLLVAAINLRRWLWVLTSFTIAHGATYTLATLGWVQVRPELIEPVIALTILFTTASSLLRISWSLRTEIPLVFGLGLFHGLGFASAMASQLGTVRFPVSTVLGFNLGVEAGQLAIAFSVGLLFKYLISSAVWADRIKLSTLWLCFTLGGFWLFERIA